MSKVIQDKPIIIAPFCIMHYDDPSTNTFHGFINYPTRIKNENGIERLECLPDPKKYGGRWKIYGTFYALSPMIRPIPSGLKLINSKQLIQYPYNTNHINYVFDPFDIQQDTVSFITWTKPVPSTVPLYLHITPDGGSYPSFDKNPPSKGNWKQNKLKQLYVLVDPNTHFTTLDSNLYPLINWNKNKDGSPMFRFKGSDNRCLPNKDGVTIQKCFLETDEDLLHQNINFGPTPLLNRLENTNSSKNLFIFIIPFICIALFILIFISRK